MPHILHSARNGRPRASIFHWRNYGALGIVGFPFLLRIKILAPLFPSSITQIQRRTTRRSPFATKLTAPLLPLRMAPLTAMWPSKTKAAYAFLAPSLMKLSSSWVSRKAGRREGGSHHQVDQRNGSRRLIPNTASFTRRAPKAPSWFYYAARALWPG